MVFGEGVLRPIEQGGEIRRTTAIGMQLLNKPAVRSNDFVARRVFSEPERSERFASRQVLPLSGRSWLAVAAPFRMVVVEIRLEQSLRIVVAYLGEQTNQLRDVEFAEKVAFMGA